MKSSMSMQRILVSLFVTYAVSLAQGPPPPWGLTDPPTTSPTTATLSPTSVPTFSPTDRPTQVPTKAPTSAPTFSPTSSPTQVPTKGPAASPTMLPSKVPSASPTQSPTVSPIKMPTLGPTPSPTVPPTQLPTTPIPTKLPTTSPTPAPLPTEMPTTMFPTTYPPTTYKPTAYPTNLPSVSPTPRPTDLPTTFAPTGSPTPRPSLSPTTAAPTRYINPFCPPRTVYEIIGSVPHYSLGTAVEACWLYTDVAHGFLGHLQCDYFGCCLCDAIYCGDSTTGMPCQTAKFGDRSVTGVRGIHIDGNPLRVPAAYAALPNGAPNTGAVVECSGVEACKAAEIEAQFIGRVECSGDYSCQATKMVINDPAPHAQIICSGLLGCFHAEIEINVGGALPPGGCKPSYAPQNIYFGAIQFSAQQSGQDVHLTINNLGCDKLILQDVQCADAEACSGAQFAFNGNIELQDCGFQNLGIVPQGSLQCSTAGMRELSCGQGFVVCTQIAKVIDNPPAGFKVTCMSLGSCTNMQMEINMRADPANPNNYVSNIGGFVFGAAGAGQGAVISVNNYQNSQVPGSTGKSMKVDKLTCMVGGACSGVTLVAGMDVDIFALSIECLVPGACANCLLVSDGGVQFPCDYTQPGGGATAMLLPGTPQQL